MFHVKQSADERKRMRVYGGVQGVGFRYFVRTHARRLAIRGYVLNRADGTVEIEAAGPVLAMAELIHTVGYGPPGARVEHIEQLPPGDDTLPEPFEVRRDS